MEFENLKTKTTIKILIVLFLYSFFTIGCSEKKEVTDKKQKEHSYFYPATTSNMEQQTTKTVYVPVYSHVYTSEEKYERMGITLSIRNTDSNENMLVKNILYYNTEGDLIETFIDKPHYLKPMASIDFIVDLRDMRGGSGANFIIKWEGSQTLLSPVIQAVMVNNTGNRAFSFITEGYTIKKGTKQ